MPPEVLPADPPTIITNTSTMSAPDDTMVVSWFDVMGWKPAVVNAETIVKTPRRTSVGRSEKRPETQMAVVTTPTTTISQTAEVRTSISLKKCSIRPRQISLYSVKFTVPKSMSMSTMISIPQE